MTDSPLISVIITSYNQMHYIYQTIDSALSQDYPNIELIVTDDGSDDFLVDNVKDYIMRNNSGNITNAVVLKNEINIGTVKNLNGALAVASGKYVMLIAGDDLYAPNCMSPSVEFMENNKSIYVAAGDYSEFHDGDNIRDIKPVNDSNLLEKLSLNSEDLFVYLCKKGFISAISAFIFRREFFLKEGYFDERYRLYEDRPMVLRIARLGYRTGYLGYVVLLYRVNVGVSSSGNIQLLRDVKMLAEYEYWPNIDVLGKRFCRAMERRNNFIYDMRVSFFKMVKAKKILFCLRNFDVILFKILPEFGVKALLSRYRKYRR